MDKQVTEKLVDKRLLSLDAFRGFTIALMIVVNNPGDWSNVYEPLLHAKWHGITPTDLVFPFFLYIVGVSIVLAYTKRLDNHANKSLLYRKILIRSLKIFAIGIFLNLFPYFDFEDLRVAGVLQRIAIVFLCCSILFLNSTWKTWIVISFSVLLGYWFAMALIPIPGIGSGFMEPGKNLSAWIDSVLLPGRLYQGTWDPEGLFSTFPAVITGITGMLTGQMIISKNSLDRKIIWLFSLGFASFIIGGIWGWAFPINKNLWTSSFVLYTSGAASMTLASCMFVVDVLQFKKWTRIGRIFGANAITVYVISGILPGLLNVFTFEGSTITSLFMDIFTSLNIEPKMVSLFYAVVFTFVCYIPAYYLYKKKIFIKL